MLDRLFPRSLDNDYRGWRTALWLFGLVITVRALQSTVIIFNSQETITGADGIPIDTFAPVAAQTVTALFGLLSLWRLVFSLLGAIVLVRYRTAVPLMFLLMAVHFVATQAFVRFVPLPRVGSPPGTMVNLVQFGLIVIGLVLSLIPRRKMN